LAAASNFVPPTPAQLAALFPNVEITSLIGKGGMGAVYRGLQKKLNRQVAIKILPPEIGRDASFAERFTREAQALARLSHPNIVTIHDVGQAGDFYYFVMEYVDGANLREIIRGGDCAPQQALAIVQQVCDALAYAHSLGIVHRDIKPENILVDGAGKVKIADFGLAKLVGSDTPNVSLTGTEQVMGTWRYMAPEQMENARQVDHRADIYSLGVVFYELLTGEVPMGRFHPPSEKVQVDVRVDEVVLKTLEREPTRRYQHASHLRSDIDQCSSGNGKSFARQQDKVDRGSRTGSRSWAVLSWMLVGMIALAGVLSAVSVGVYLLSYTDHPSSVNDPNASLSEDERIERAETLTGEGYQLWGQQQLAPAIAKFTEAVALDPQSAQAWNGLGWAKFNGGQSAEAIPAFEKCLELEPEHPAALNGLGQIYLSMGEFEKAETYLLKASRQASASWVGLGRLYLLTGKYDEAQSWLQKVIGEMPNDPILKRMLEAATKKELPDDLRQLIAPPSKEHQVETASAARAWQLANEGKLRSAEIAFRRVLAKNPNDASALNGLGFCLLNSGKTASAKEYFEKCLKINPQEIGALNGLARCLKAEGKTDEAIFLWEKVREMPQNAPAATVLLASTYMEQGEYAKALPLYEELASAYPGSAQYREALKAARKGIEKKEAEATPEAEAAPEAKAAAEAEAAAEVEKTKDAD
jgi:serine/threonine protein kinase/thioredoxin-like negative regulator of GroEL